MASIQKYCHHLPLNGWTSGDFEMGWNGDHSDTSKIKPLEVHWTQWNLIPSPLTIWAFIIAISWWLGAGSVAKWRFGCFSCKFLHCINSMWNRPIQNEVLANVFPVGDLRVILNFSLDDDPKRSTTSLSGVGHWKSTRKLAKLSPLLLCSSTNAASIGFNLAMHYSRVIGQPRDLSFDQLQLKVLEQLGSKGFSSFNFCLYLDALHCIIYSKERETSLNLQMWQYDTSSFSRPPDLPFLSKYLWL